MEKLQTKKEEAQAPKAEYTHHHHYTWGGVIITFIMGVVVFFLAKYSTFLIRLFH